MAASHKVWTEWELGDLLLAAGDKASSVRYYRMAIATAEPILVVSPNDSATQRRFIYAVRGLSEEQARSGERTEAVATLDLALNLMKTVNAAPNTPPLIRSLCVARVAQAARSVYALLGDRDNARVWYQRAFDEWQRLEKMKGFLPPRRRDMETAGKRWDYLIRIGSKEARDESRSPNLLSHLTSSGSCATASNLFFRVQFSVCCFSQKCSTFTKK